MSSISAFPIAQDADGVDSFALAKRYNDAYKLARFQNGLGQTVKAVSRIFGLLVAGPAFLFMLSSSVPSQSMFGTNTIGIGFGLFGTVAGLSIVGIGWILGSIVAAQGQQLKATLDTAVCSNPFLDNAARAKMMSL